MKTIYRNLLFYNAVVIAISIFFWFWANWFLAFIAAYLGILFALFGALVVDRFNLRADVVGIIAYIVWMLLIYLLAAD